MASYMRKMQKFCTFSNLWSCITDPTRPLTIMVLLFIAEFIVNFCVIKYVPYTEIDWKAYMQEVEGVINGTYDYMELKGDTGPLVYPAGFVYIFTALYYITDHGKSIITAQYIFLFIYMLNLYLVFRIYNKVWKVPPYVLVFMCCASYRVHSIYVLRLFNDPVAMLFVYLAINLFIGNKWIMGSVAFSLGVSVKMNILLFSPALFLLMIIKRGISRTFLYLLICAAIQLILAMPFLRENPEGYIMRSFDVGRQFFFKWTVNWRFLPEDVFLNRSFHIVLLVSHALVAMMFCLTRTFVRKQTTGQPLMDQWIAANDIVLPMFGANFIGMCFSRSLHYQFYIWYFHSLHYLIWSAKMPTVFRFLMLGVIELCWNTYPSTPLSSAALHICHLMLLVCLWIGTAPSSMILSEKKDKPEKVEKTRRGKKSKAMKIQ